MSNDTTGPYTMTVTAVCFAADAKQDQPHDTYVLIRRI